jgi:hypothetical protein
LIDEAEIILTSSFSRSRIAVVIIFKNTRNSAFVSTHAIALALDLVLASDRARDCVFVFALISTLVFACLSARISASASASLSVSKVEMSLLSSEIEQWKN